MSVFDRVELADLRVFLTIMRTRNFKAAAIQLGVTPSAASHAMRRLEERLGAKLLNRTSRAVAPTDTGLALAGKLEEGFDTIGSALAEIDAPGARRFGTLRINVFADAAHLFERVTHRIADLGEVGAAFGSDRIGLFVALSA